MLKSVLFTLLCCMSLSAQAVVILQYHHVAEDTPKVTSVTPAQLSQQMAYLHDNDFKVIPLSEVVESIKQGKALPPKTVAITFDDGYKSIAENAQPILSQYGFPYTIFISVEPIERHFHSIMDWQTLNRLVEGGAELANHSWGHEHLIRVLDGETEEQWLARIEKNLLSTEAAIKKQTGQNHKMLAYPYGEYNVKLEALLQKHGFVGFGQQSGAAGPYSSLTALPRFPVAGAYANFSSLKVKINSLNMPVLEMSPLNTQLAMGEWRPEMKVKLDMSDINASEVTCYILGQAVKPTWISADEFSVQADKDLPAGRSRYNCTARSKSKGQYYWYSQAWVRTKDDGSWIKE
ncbi:polysaccharide deacetylase family protein [Shewanella sp. Isolate11]|uniref:polysaccharide deacetylase family protein n=1 Tax=Shewanella sp. Isolate11 TaxID=2908530 RepID=UPI001EFCF78D|nr:polysaccharide deacetylase family protein [Shewanella sp. Isolate11]MCG9698049.1 polysaccharide deacetylase family protein [Shewanella sp. Isolate11]